MKKFILIALNLFHLTWIHSQGVNSDTLRFNPLIDSVAEKLVDMAMLNARISSIENNAYASEYDYMRSRTTWLNNIVVSGNVNEFSLKNEVAANPLNQSTQYPRYNIGVILPLGLFINNGKQTRANYYRYEAAIDQIKKEKQDIRREVLTSYENYLMNKRLLSVQQSLLQDAKILLSRHEEKFAEGQLTLEQYTNTSKQYYAEKVQVINLIRDLKIIVVELESLIGMNIEIALDQINRGTSAK